jgi:hypothetical protein
LKILGTILSKSIAEKRDGWLFVKEMVDAVLAHVLWDPHFVVGSFHQIHGSLGFHEDLTSRFENVDQSRAILTASRLSVSGMSNTGGCVCIKNRFAFPGHAF